MSLEGIIPFLMIKSLPVQGFCVIWQLRNLTVRPFPGKQQVNASRFAKYGSMKERKTILQLYGGFL